MEPNWKSVLKQLDPAWSGKLPTFGRPIQLKDAEGNPIHLIFGEEPIDISRTPEAVRLRTLRDELIERYGQNPPRSPATVNEMLDQAEARLLATALLLGVPAAVLAAHLDRVIVETAVTKEQLTSIRLSLGIPEPGESIRIAGKIGDEPSQQ